jgi:hypothetical protein
MLVSACAQLMNGQMQPVKLIDAKKNIYMTTCSGAVEDWGSCGNKAKDTCENGYEVINRLENPVAGRRELFFACKK